MKNERFAMMEKFITEEWDISMVLTPNEISSKVLRSTNKIARYYSQLFVDNGMLCRVVIDGRIHYTRGEWYPLLKKYSSLNDVEIK